MLPPSLDPSGLDVVPEFLHYFRYPLHADDFHALRMHDDDHARLLGYYTAKPLYGKLDERGHVDRSAGFNGEIATVFVPSPARSWQHARLLHARMPPSQVQRADGKRNWPAILATARRAIRRTLPPGQRIGATR